MRFIKIKNAVLLLTLVILVTLGCKKDEFAINTNPNNITESTVDYKSVLPSSQANTATIVATNWTVLQKWLGFWARSGSYQSIDDEETYSFFTTWAPLNTIWNNLYSNSSNYNFVQNKANAAGAGIYEAIARIMKAQNFQMLVDVFGNVPYSQALNGASISTPKYDDDADIYKDLLRQLDTAIVLLNDPVRSLPDANPAIAQNDLVYQGNTTSWKRYANTLKLRMLMHLGNTSFAGGNEVNTFANAGIDVPAEMAIIQAEGSGFIPAGQSAQINPGYSATKPTPFYRNYVRTENNVVAAAGDVTRANFYAVGSPGVPGYYQWDGDPRVDRFYRRPAASATNPSGAHNGIEYGRVSDASVGGPLLSTIDGPGLVPTGTAGASARAWLFTSVESLFLQAEAAQRGVLAGSPEAMTKAAITESFVWLGLTATQATNYINGNATYPDVDYNGDSQGPGLPGGGMYTIFSQKWFGLNAIAPLEIWTDYRRAQSESNGVLLDHLVYGEGGGFDPGPPISIHPNNTATKIPVRLLYPDSEYSYNPTNVAAQGIINYFNPGSLNKIFWDQN